MKWKTDRILDDVVIAAYAINRKTDKRTIKRLSLALHIPQSKLEARMADFSMLHMGKYPSRHYSYQEKKVYDWLMHTASALLTIKPSI